MFDCAHNGKSLLHHESCCVHYALFLCNCIAAEDMRVTLHIVKRLLHAVCLPAITVLYDMTSVCLVTICPTTLQLLQDFVKAHVGYSWCNMPTGPTGCSCVSDGIMYLQNHLMPLCSHLSGQASQTHHHMTWTPWWKAAWTKQMPLRLHIDGTQLWKSNSQSKKTVLPTCMNEADRTQPGDTAKRALHFWHEWGS